MRAGAASRTPVARIPIRLGRDPSISDASGLLPAQAMAHTAITRASLSGPASLASRVRVAELATRQAAPAKNAAPTLNQKFGDSTKAAMQMPSTARAVAARWREGVCFERRSDPSTL